MSCAILPHTSERKQINDVSLPSMMKETQFELSENEDQIKLIWWIPADYWLILDAKLNLATEKNSKVIDNALSPYIVILVIQAKLDSSGKMSFYNAKETGENLLVEYINADGKKRIFKNLEYYNSRAKGFLEKMKPHLASLLKQTGENTNFFVFSNYDELGNIILSPYLSGKLIITLAENDQSGRSYREIDMPLMSLMVN